MVLLIVTRYMYIEKTSKKKMNAIRFHLSQRISEIVKIHSDVIHSNLIFSKRKEYPQALCIYLDVLKKYVLSRQRRKDGREQVQEHDPRLRNASDCNKENATDNERLINGQMEKDLVYEKTLRERDDSKLAQDIETLIMKKLEPDEFIKEFTVVHHVLYCAIRPEAFLKLISENPHSLLPNQSSYISNSLPNTNDLNTLQTRINGFNMQKLSNHHKREKLTCLLRIILPQLTSSTSPPPVNLNFLRQYFYFRFLKNLFLSTYASCFNVVCVGLVYGEQSEIENDDVMGWYVKSLTKQMEALYIDFEFKNCLVEADNKTNNHYQNVTYSIERIKKMEYESMIDDLNKKLESGEKYEGLRLIVDGDTKSSKSIVIDMRDKSLGLLNLAIQCKGNQNAKQREYYSLGLTKLLSNMKHQDKVFILDVQDSNRMQYVQCQWIERNIMHRDYAWEAFCMGPVIEENQGQKSDDFFENIKSKLDTLVGNVEEIFDEKSLGLDEQVISEYAIRIALSSIIVQLLSAKHNKTVQLKWNSLIEGSSDIGKYIQYTCSRISGIERNSIHLLDANARKHFNPECLSQSPELYPLLWELAKYSNVLPTTLSSANCISSSPKDKHCEDDNQENINRFSVVTPTLSMMESSTLISYLNEISRKISSKSYVLRVKDVHHEISIDRLIFFQLCKQVLVDGMLILGINPVDFM